MVAGAAAALLTGGRLTTGAIRGTEADRAQRLAEDALGFPGASSFTVIFHSAPLAADPRVAAIEAPLDVPPPLAARLVSRDGHRALVTVTLRDPVQAAAREYPALRAGIVPGPFDLTFTGMLPFLDDLDAILAHDLRRA